VNKNNKPKKKKNKLVVAIFVILCLLIAALEALAIFVFSNLAEIKDVDPVPSTTAELSGDPNELDADPNQTELNEKDLADIEVEAEESAFPEGVYHVMLFGLDTRDEDQFTGARSDVMLLVTLDTRDKTIKLTSFMRDTLVPIPGHSYNRLNAAFVFGGPKLATEVISKQFGLKVEKYAVVNFWSTAEIIDIVGGVKVNVKGSELEQVNRNIRDINYVDKSKKTKELKKSGEQTLNGRQAVAYMRIRHVGTDVERTQRQRTVLANMTKKLTNMSLDQMLAFIDTIPKHMRTNLSQGDMVNYVKAAYEVRGGETKQLRIPADETYKGANYKGMSILKPDFKENAAKLKKFLNF